MSRIDVISRHFPQHVFVSGKNGCGKTQFIMGMLGLDLREGGYFNWSIEGGSLIRWISRGIPAWVIIPGVEGIEDVSCIDSEVPARLFIDLPPAMLDEFLLFLDDIRGWNVQAMGIQHLRPTALRILEGTGLVLDKEWMSMREVIFSFPKSCKIVFFERVTGSMDVTITTREGEVIDPLPAMREIAAEEIASRKRKIKSLRRKAREAGNREVAIARNSSSLLAFKRDLEEKKGEMDRIMEEMDRIDHFVNVVLRKKVVKTSRIKVLGEMNGIMIPDDVAGFVSSLAKTAGYKESIVRKANLSIERDDLRKGILALEKKIASLSRRITIDRKYAEEKSDARALIAKQERIMKEWREMIR